MDSRLYGVPLSTTQATPSPPPPKVSFSGIRAPLTIDSDVEIQHSNTHQDTAFYYSNSESEGFFSGEDEFVIDSERPIVKFQDGVDDFQDSSLYDFNSGSDGFFSGEDEFVIDSERPIVKFQDGVDDFQDSSLYDFNSGSEGFFSGEDEFVIDSVRPIVKYEDGMEDFQQSGHSGQYGDFRPVPKLSDSFEETTNLDQVEETKEGNFGSEKNGSFSPVIKAKVNSLEIGMEYGSDDNVHDQVSFPPKPSMPIAQVSGVSDDDGSVNSEVLDDDEFFIPVRIPDKVLERFNSIPKVRALKDVEKENTPSKSQVLLELKASNDSIWAEFGKELSPTFEVKDMSGLSGGQESDEVVEDSIHDIYESVGQAYSQPSEQGTESDHSAVESHAQDDDYILEKPSLDGEKDIDANHGFGSANVQQDNVRSQSSEPGLECDLSAVETKVQHDNHVHEKQDVGLYEDAEQIGLDNKSVEESPDEQTNWIIDSHDNLTVGGSHSPEGSIQDDGVPSTDLANLPDKLVHQASVHSTEGHLLEDEGDFSVIELVEDIEQFSDNGAMSLILNSPDVMEEEMEKLSQRLIPDMTPVDEISVDYVGVDGQVTTDSDEEVEGHSDNQGEEIFDAAVFAALLKVASNAGTVDNSISVISSDGTSIYPLERFGGLGSSSDPLGPNTDGVLSKPSKKQLDNLQQIRVKYLRLLQRLDRSAEDPTAAQVLHKLVLAAGKTPIHEFSFESAKRAATELEADGKNDLKLSMTILVIGKTGVGKSATINSIFAEKKTSVNAFEPTTTHVKEITGNVNGVNIRVLDTPGLRSSLADQSRNSKILFSIKKIINKYPPDVILYVDRLDSQARDLNDLPLLKSITRYIGSGIWHNVIVTLTHGASSPPDGPYGYPLSYETYIARRSHIVQQLINYSVSDVSLLTPGLMCPVAIVENNFLFQADGNGETFLPNGENWRSKLLLLCCSTKILSELSSVFNAENALEHKKFFSNRKRHPPLLYFLSSLLQPNVHPKLNMDGGVENGDSDMELKYSSESDQEDEDEYDKVPPFKPLKKSQVAELSKDQRKAYHEEYAYRVKLLQKKQLREELKRIREMKAGRNQVGNYDHNEGESDQETGNSTAIPLLDMILPPSFDGNNPAYLYRFLESSSRHLTRPVLNSHGWDHDVGYDGVSIDDSQAISGQFPAIISMQLTKDKRVFNIHLNSYLAAKHGDNGSTMVGLDIQTLGNQLAYILKSEYKLKNYKINRTAAGLSVTFFDKNIVKGLRMEDQIALGKQLALVLCTGATHCQGDGAYGANVEVRWREKDYPVGQDKSTFGLSIMKWRGELIWGCNLQSEFSVGRNYRMGIKAGLNNKMSGQISIRTISSDQLQIVMLVLVPIAKTIFRNIFLAV